MIVYKLTNAQRQTRFGFQYEVGVPREATGQGAMLCSDGVLHAYETPEQAAFMCVNHCERDQRTLWRAETPAVVVTDGTKVGVKSLTLVEPMALPELSSEQRAQVAIALAWPLSFGDRAAWRTWASAWLTGTDRCTAYASAVSASAAAPSLCATLAQVLTETCLETLARLETV